MPVRLLESAAVALALSLLRQLIVARANRRIQDQRGRHRWRRITAYAAFAIGAVLIGAIWYDALGSVATVLGLVSAGLVIALQSPLTNLAGWLFIASRRPFSIGDRIQIGEHAGDVVDIRIFEFTLLEILNWVDADQSTGRVIHIPNGQVFSLPVSNYSKGIGFIWNELAVRLTFESDWEKAKVLLAEIAGRHDAQLGPEEQEKLRQTPRPYLILYSVLTPTVYTRVDTHGVRLTVRYLCEPRRRRSSEHAIWEDTLRAFAGHRDIEFAYPTTRFYQRLAEGRHISAHVDRDAPFAQGCSNSKEE